MGAKVGHEVSEATRLKISEALKGRKRETPWLVGLKKSDEAIRKHAEKMRKHWTCTVDGCERPHHSNGLCGTHYERFRHHGDASVVLLPKRGIAHPKWKGDAIGYDAAHVRARATMSAICSACGQTGRLEVALRHSAAAANLREANSGPYSVSVADYVTLCVTCHRRYDSPKADTRASVARLIQ